MTFVLTEDQQMLRDTAMSFAADTLPVSHLRGLRDAGANGVDPKSRAKLAELGFFGVLVPEEHGGSEFGMVGMGQILEAQGRSLAATPLLQTGVIGASALTLGGSQAQKAEWLPKIAAGEVLTALALDATGPRRWRLSQPGQPDLEIPLDAEGADALFDAFAALPGLRSGQVVAAMRRPAPGLHLLWERGGAEATRTRLH